MVCIIHIDQNGRICKKTTIKAVMQRFFEMLDEELKGLTTNEQEEVLKRLLEIYPKLKRRTGNERRIYGLRKQATTPNA